MEKDIEKKAKRTNGTFFFTPPPSPPLGHFCSSFSSPFFYIHSKHRIFFLQKKNLFFFEFLAHTHKMATTLTPDELAAIRRALPELMLREKLLTKQLQRNQFLLGLAGGVCPPRVASACRSSPRPNDTRLTRRLRRAAVIARRQHARRVTASATAAAAAAANATCLICLSATSETTSCGHPVHETCISLWANECLENGSNNITCPACRRTLVA